MPPSPPRLAFVFAILALLAAPTARAGKTLKPLRKGTIEGLVPLLEQGELALVESSSNGRLAQITLLKLVDASPERVLEGAADPKQFPRFIPNISEIEVLQHQGAKSKIAWEMELPFVTLNGINRCLDQRP